MAQSIADPHELDVIDLTAYLNGEGTGDLPARVLASLRNTSCLVVKDPRVTTQQNEDFLDLMESYFSLPREQKMKDARPEQSFQIGVTPDFQEEPRSVSDPEMKQLMETYGPDNKATVPRGSDPKWRYFWKLLWPSEGEPAESSTDGVEQVVPEGFPAFEETMEKWGNSMLQAVATVAKLLAVGYGLEEDTFKEMLLDGRHLLAPTEFMGKLKNRSTLLFAYSSLRRAPNSKDISFVTCHGKSRFPGLFIWLRSGERVPVKVPQGCLLLQAGKQLAWLTGGDIKEGMHEVVCSDATVQAVERARAAGKSCWRVSSTVFSHISPPVVLKPIAGNLEATEEYQPITVQDYVDGELQMIKLAPATIAA